jgi:hypothetical protein
MKGNNYILAAVVAVLGAITILIGAIFIYEGASMNNLIVNRMKVEQVTLSLDPNNPNSSLQSFRRVP